MTKKHRFESVCGMSETGVDAFLDNAEAEDKGTDRYPWPDGFKDEVKTAINGMTFMDAVQRKINDMVVAKLGPGLLGRGPFRLPLAQ